MKKLISIILVLLILITSAFTLLPAMMMTVIELVPGVMVLVTMEMVQRMHRSMYSRRHPVSIVMEEASSNITSKKQGAMAPCFLFPVICYFFRPEAMSSSSNSLGFLR